MSSLEARPGQGAHISQRLKCDETRPACNQCTSRNVICPGYQAPVRWSSKYEVLRPPQDETTQGSRRNRSRTSLSTRLNAHEQAEASSRSPNDPPHTTVRNESGLGTIAIDSIPDNAERREKNITAAEFALVGRDPRSNVLPTVSANLMDNQSSHNNNEATAPVPGMEAYDAFELFNLSDQDFWNSLSVPWPQNLQDFPISRPWSPDTAEANDTGLDRMVMRNDTAEPQIPSFNPNEVTNDDARVLLEYYFTSIIPLNSFYDSDDNPLRYLVSAYVKTSPLIYNCVLSASAMHRMSRNKDMHRVVVHYHSQALQCLETAIERVDVVTQSTVNQVTGGQRDFPAIRVDRLQELLLALLLLGVTAVSENLELFPFLTRWEFRCADTIPSPGQIHRMSALRNFVPPDACSIDGSVPSSTLTQGVLIRRASSETKALSLVA